MLKQIEFAVKVSGYKLWIKTIIINIYIFKPLKFPTILTFHHILIKFVKIIKKLYIVSINFVILMERLLLRVLKVIF